MAWAGAEDGQPGDRVRPHFPSLAVGGSRSRGAFGLLGGFGVVLVTMR